jgi:radical SAM superfamily enzyme YgiQ (UPF0313 family)
MQPLGIAVLAALTPPEWQKTFYDDRLEPVDYDKPTDLVAISIETFTAKRGYQIAEEYRRRRVPVVIGGYHATFCPEEVLEHADAVCVGEAEDVWSRILQDAVSGRLSRAYSRPCRELRGIIPDRSIFRGKDYFSIAMVETGRGCRSQCNFCSITAFHKATYRRRPAEEIVQEIQRLDEKAIFFVDDNVIGDVNKAKELFHALEPLGIRWVGQANVNVVKDLELIDLMARSGCAGLLIGFESLSSDNLACMGKVINQTVDYREAIRAFRERGIPIYGTFMSGLRGDSAQLILDTVRFAEEQKLFLAAFAHIIPFPGTPLYNECERQEQLVHKRWWLSETYRFGQIPFRPTCMESWELEQCCHEARRAFYGLSSILHRALDIKANCANIRTASLFFSLNLLLRREVSQKRGLPLGLRSTHGAIHRVRAERATASDDAELRNVLREMPMPGAVRIAYLREPSFFEALQVEGRYNEVIVGRDEATRCIVGLGSRSVKSAFINGHPSPLGYLSSLRLAEGYRGGMNLARGYRFLRELHGDGRTKLYVTTIMEHNTAAREILTSHRAGLPTYYDFGQFRCMAISLRNRLRLAHSGVLEIRSAERQDVPSIIRFWQHVGAKRQFFPEYSAADLLSSEGLLRGLRLENIILAVSGQELVGTVAAWDQKSFRQSVVTGYNRRLASLRLPYNITARLLGYPVLPRPGSSLDYLSLALTCIREDDSHIFGLLLEHVIQRYQADYSLLMAGLHERDPLVSVLRRYHHFPYASRLYVVCWEDGEEDLGNLEDWRVPYLELGAL